MLCINVDFLKSTIRMPGHKILGSLDIFSRKFLTMYTQPPFHSQAVYHSKPIGTYIAMTGVWVWLASYINDVGET